MVTVAADEGGAAAAVFKLSEKELNITITLL
jgi:hypothetical protein